MRSALRSVPVRAALAAAVVVATALAMAELALLGVLRADLSETARAQAAADAQQLAATITAGAARLAMVDGGR